MRILLGSKSPRRQQLLAGLDLPFSLVDIDADESFPADLMEEQIPLFISRSKSNEFLRSHTLETDQVLITADTIVWCDGRVLGKPTDHANAIRMLHFLSGKTHQVYTGVTIAWITEQGLVQEQFADKTDVSFRKLEDSEIEAYIDKYKPYDKAGSYGVQEWIGYVGIDSIHGSHYNVMGFPIEKVYLALRRIGYIEK